MAKQGAISIRTRLIALVVAAIALAQLVGLGFALWQEVAQYAQARRDGLFSTAQVIAAAGARATLERDVPAAYQTIRAVGRIDRLVFAGLERLDGEPLADVGATEQLASDLVLTQVDAPISLPALLRARTMEVRVPVIYGGAQVGMVRVIADTRDLPERLRATVSMTLAGGLAALALALLVALRMQSGITAPLLRLSRAMESVRASHDYSVALEAGQRDEVGILVEGFNGMIGDIRERDARLARHRARLEQDVAERTADYRRAASEAESANRAKSDFLATMSHEIRTPMNGVLVMAELLAVSGLPPKARKQAEVIARSGASLLAIINDILDLSKIEAGKLEVEALDVDPVECVETALRLFADRARTKGLDLAARIESAPGTVLRADPTRLGQVLANLVNNALKFTERGGVVVVAAPDGPDRLRFSVEDTGIGIAQDKLATIFEAFSQADQSTTRQFGGTGLGLTIARRLVVAMGGELQVTSSPGQGTAFFFSLPLAGHSPLQVPAHGCAQGEDRPRAVIALPGAQSAAAAMACLSAAGFAVEAVTDETLPASAAGARLVLTVPDRLMARPRLGVAAGGGIVVLSRGEQEVQPLRASRRLDAVLAWPLMPSELAALLARLDEGLPLEEDEAQEAEAGLSFAGLRVLVADDAEVNREVADAALSRLGIKADFVENGQQALDALAARPYDIVLMDGSMPVLDGFAATRALREAEARTGQARTPVVALTAHVVGTAADAWREAGMDGVLHKPFTLAGLAGILQTHARGAQEALVASAPPAPENSAAPKDLNDALDRAVLQDLLVMANGASAVVERITGLYRTQSADRLADLRAALEAGDLDQLGQAAHALKSMSFNVGARTVAEGAADIEHAARIESRLPERAAYEALETAHLAALEALAAWRPEAA